MKTLEEVKQEYLEKALSRPILKYCVKNAKGKIVSMSDSRVVHCFNNEEDDAYAEQHYKLKEVYNGMKFWYGEKAPSGLFCSADGQYYEEADLPEHNDEFCTEKYAREVKAERNSRISDTDDYVNLSDITVQESANAKRRALNDTDKEELLAYRQALRDMPEQESFPFVDYPEFPSALAYELENKANGREIQREYNARF